MKENVIKYYVLCNKLKNIIRTGWLDWNVKKERLESVAEHVYGVQMLAIGMYSEYKYDIDLSKVLLMLAIHELEETIIGDLTCFQISEEEKQDIGHKAVEQVLESLYEKDYLKSIIYEFDERKTKEAIFAYHCDKLECILQCKLYDEENCVDLNNQKSNHTKDEKVKKLLEVDKLSWSQMWVEFHKQKFIDDKNFLEVCQYVKYNEISGK